MNQVSLFALLALVGMTAACADKEAQRQAKVQEDLIKDQVARVTLISPEIGSIAEELPISGAFESMDSVSLGAKIGGRLTMVSVDDGSPVKRGQVVATVESAALAAEVRRAQAAVDAALSAKAQAQTQAAISPVQSESLIRQAEAGLKSAKARLDLVKKGARDQEKRAAQERVNGAKSALTKAKSDLDRFKNLYANDAVAKADVDAAQLVYDMALVEYQTALEMLEMILEGSRPEEIRQAEEDAKQAEEQLRNAKASATIDTVRKQQVEQADAALRQARAQLVQATQALADARITSPIDGYVSGKPAQVGQVVAPGTPVAQIVGVHGIYLVGQIPEKEISRVRVGQAAKVRVEAYPNERFDATVVAIRPVVDSLGRIFSARIAVNDPSNRLRPGMFGYGAITIEALENAVIIPTDAILKDGGSHHVFVANGSKAKKVVIRTGIAQDGKTQVFDLSPNERVLHRGIAALKDGAEFKEDVPNRSPSEAK